MRTSSRFVFAALLYILFALFCVFPQTSSSLTPPLLPSAPIISDAPAMPSISAPTIGSPFYKPGNNYHLQQPQKNSMPKTNITYSDSDQQKTAETSAKTEKQSALQQVLGSSYATGTADADWLSAGDIAALGQNGLINGIYGLFGNSSAVYPAAGSTDVLLSRILERLNELKNEQKDTASEKKTKDSDSSAQNSFSYAQNDKSQRPAILRFIINGYNVLDTCRTIYFSKKEIDGSFLLTGDRKYLSNNAVREETFYLLFKADGNSGSSKGYNVQPAVVQDYQNEYSLVYQLAQKNNLRAAKTGNLVSLRSTSSDWNLDLLLDIGE